MQKIINAIAKIWGILFFIGKIVTIPYRYLVWRPVRWFFRTWVGRSIQVMAMRLVFVGLVLMGIGIWFGHSDMAGQYGNMIPKVGCPSLVNSVPGVRTFCMSETEAAVMNLDFDENIIGTPYVGERPHNFFGNEEEERPQAPEVVDELATPVPTPMPATADGALPKCELCKASLVDVNGDRGVIDGDTLRIEFSGQEFKLRLRGVDAYEMDQQCGTPDYSWQCGRDSRNGLVGMLEGDFVYFTYEADGKYHKPSHDRFVADVFRNNYEGMRFGALLVEGGYAVPAPDFLRSGEKAWFAEAHEFATTNSIGVYRQGQPIPEEPRAYRRAQSK